MSQRPAGDYPIDESTVSGTALARLLERQENARISNNMGANRPAYLPAGGIWSKSVTGGYDLMLWTGTTDILIGGKNAAFLSDAPSDGKGYSRLNGAWSHTYTATQADARYAPLTHNHTWSQITGKPATYPPTLGTGASVAAAGNHTHSSLYYTKAEVDAKVSGANVTWAAITGKPATFPPQLGTGASVAAAGNHAHTTYLSTNLQTNKTAGDLIFSTNVACKLGNARLYQASASLVRLDLVSQSFVIRSGTSDRFTFDSSGNFVAVGNVTANSDRRLKKNLDPIGNALQRVAKLTGYTYDRVDLATGRQAGIVAQELKSVVPEAVQVGQDTQGTLSVNPLGVIGLLVNAVNELAAKVEELENGVTN